MTERSKPRYRVNANEERTGQADSIALLIILRRANGHPITYQDLFVMLKENPPEVFNRLQQSLQTPASLDKFVGAPDETGKHTMTLADLIPDEGVNVEDEVLQNVDCEELRRLLLSYGLTEKQADVLMYLGEGMLYKDVAQKIGAKDIQNVQGLRNRAKEKLLKNPDFRSRFGLPNTLTS